MKNTYTTIIKRDGDFWIGYVKELPGANSQGETLEEVRENLKEAIALILEYNMMEEHYFRQNVENGIRELDEGKGTPHEEAVERR